MNKILIYYCSQIFYFYHILYGHISYHYNKILPALWQQDINIYLIFSAFTPKPNPLLVSNRACVFFFIVFVFAQYVNIICIDQELMCSNYFQSPMIFLDLLDGLSYRKAEKQCQQRFPLFQTILNMKCITQTFTCADFTTGFVSTHFS